jgi:pseudouridine kinase
MTIGRIACAAPIACLGGAHLDRHGVLHGPLLLGTSNPGRVSADFGGVARNVAENLARLGRRVSMLSRVGADETGRQVVAHLAGLGIDTSLVGVSPGTPTASYTAILETTGELVLGLADMEIYDEITPEAIEPALPRLREHGFWFADANLPAATLDCLLEAAGRIPVALDAISVVKSRKLRPLLRRISILFANLAQAASIAEVAALPDAVQAACALRQLGAHAGVVTAGASGIAVWTGDDLRSFAALPAIPRDVTGAGDALIAGTLFALTQPVPLPDAAQLGLAAAAITVESGCTTAAHLTAELLYQRHANT